MERVTHDLVTGMAEAGITSHIVAFTRSQTCVGTEISGRMAVTRCALFANPANQPMSLTWVQHGLKAGLQADGVIIHAPNFLAFPVMMLLVLLRMVGVGPAHRLLLWHSDTVNKGMLGCILRPIEFAMAFAATRIVATSPPYAESSKVLRHFRDKTAVVPLGIEPPAAGGTASPTLDEALADWIAGRPLILTVGRLVPYKGFDILIRALALIDHSVPFCCLIVGTGPEKAKLQEKLTGLGLADRVRIVGPLATEQLGTLYRTATLYCMSSRMRSEAFGVVLLEAMSHALPIVATDISGSGVPWVAGGPETAILVPPDDPSGLAAGLLRLLHFPALAEAMGIRAKARFQKSFTRERMVRSTVELLTGEDNRG